MIDNYQHKNVEDTLDAVEGFDASTLQQFLVYEREHKNRKTVIEAIQDKLVTVEVAQMGYYGGYWFDDAGEHVVKDSRRLRQAADGRKLTILD